jgi:hypothetical protein
MNHVKEGLKKKGMNLPVGISRSTSIYLTPFGDRGFAEKIVPHLLEDGVCSVRPWIDHSWEEAGAWFDIVGERNKRESSNIRIWKEAENLFMCASGDIPLVSVFYYETREKDFRRLSNDPLVELHHVNLVTTHFMEWLKSYYTLKNQWRYIPGWRAFVEKECKHVFGEKTGYLITHAMENLLRVEKLEFRPDEYDVKQIDFLIKTNNEYKAEYARVLGIGVAGINYASKIILDLKLTENIDSEEEFEDNLERVENDMNRYLESVDRAYASIKLGLDSCQRLREYFQKEVFAPIEWTCLFLRFRLYTVKAYCGLARAKGLALRNDRESMLQSLEHALRFINYAISDLRDYTRLLPYFGWDLAVNPKIEVIEEMAKDLAELRKTAVDEKDGLKKVAGISIFGFIRT